jgi:hypothetical protein
MIFNNLYNKGIETALGFGFKMLAIGSKVPDPTK